MQPLAEIIVEEGLASPEDLRRAAELADKAGVPLVVPVVRELGLDEVALVAALKRKTRVGVTDPASAALDAEALRELSRDVCRRRRVLPLSVAVYSAGARQLRLAMADPTDAVAIAEVEHFSGCQVEPTIMTLSAVEELIESAYRHLVTEVMPRTGALAERSPRDTVRVAPPAPRSTVPFHRAIDEADVAQRIEALVSVLVEKGVLDEDDYESALLALMKRDAE